jgi:hypothetical protein
MLKKESSHAERSEALLYLLESKQKQILRFAQNDVLRAFFSILLEAASAFTRVLRARACERLSTVCV